MKILDQLIDRLPIYTAKDMRGAYWYGREIGEQIGRVKGEQIGHVKGYGERMVQEQEARARAHESILRVIQGGKA